jgi:hypothetical protein
MNKSEKIEIYIFELISFTPPVNFQEFKTLKFSKSESVCRSCRILSAIEYVQKSFR